MDIFYIVCISSKVTSQSMISEALSTIYIITNFNYPGIYLLWIFAHYVFLFCKAVTGETTTDITQTSQTISVTTNSVTNGTFIITEFYSSIYFFYFVFHHFLSLLLFKDTTSETTQSTISTSITSQPISTTTTTPNTCNNGTHITWTNGSCVSRESLIVR